MRHIFLMEDDIVKIRVGLPMQQMVREIALERDVSVGQFIRDAVSREISRARNARPPVRADERLVAPLRARLADDLANSSNWDDLQRRLNEKGFTLQIAGGGLALHEHCGGRRICKASELGFSYSRLMRRFQTPFPGHPHSWLAGKMLSEVQNDDIEVVERF